mgnify:CR=1 FL=1
MAKAAISLKSSRVRNAPVGLLGLSEDFFDDKIKNSHNFLL